MDIVDDTNGDTVKSDECMPNIWLSKVKMSAWIDAGMNQNFHGVVVRMMLAMENVCIEKGRQTPSENLINPHL